MNQIIYVIYHYIIFSTLIPKIHIINLQCFINQIVSNFEKVNGKETKNQDIEWQRNKELRH